MAASFVCFIYLRDPQLSRLSLFLSVISAAVLAVIGLWALFDAYNTARNYNVTHRLLDEPLVKKKPWLAVFLSDIYPGLGQFYNRQILKGLAFVASSIILAIAAHMFSALSIFQIPLYLFTIKDAFDSAGKINGTGEKLLKQGTPIARAFVVFIIVTSFLPYGAITKAKFIQAFKIPAGSMLPTLLIGDHILVDRTSGTKASIRRGDIVVFIYPEDPTRDFVKRVIGMPGDTLEGRDKIIYINGSPIQEQYIQHVDVNIHPAPSDKRDNFGPIAVPQDTFFVMGDNRDQSYDSRFWGFVPKENIKGRAFKIYWSWDHLNTEVRWERIGLAIQ
jgi:signal peptidase I